jgi:hypothetical protein
MRAGFIEGIDANEILSDVVSAVVRDVVSVQKELDRLGGSSSGNLHCAPVTFILQQTQLTLAGSLSWERPHLHPKQAHSLLFSPGNRVQASLRGGFDAARTSLISIAILAVESARHAS